MFKKLFSLSIIVLMLLSVIGFASAATLTTYYPTSGGDRYTGDDIKISILASNENDRLYSFKSKPTMFVGTTTYNTDDERNPVWAVLLGLVRTDNWQKGQVNQVNIPSEYTNKSIYVILSDGSSTFFNYHTYFRLNNWDGSNFNVTYWDRGYARHPHVGAVYKSYYYYAMNGEDLFINSK
ncbi:MAG: hypothetical protein LBT66_03005 [Methanobrevibacter sp.]|jgi:hypothetical protein|nr:hypothetical protein [Candidatus Methanovirga meridionalis]